MAVTYIRNRIAQDVEGYDKHSQSDGSLLLAKTADVSEFELSLTIGDVYAQRHPTDDSAFISLQDDQIVIAAHGSVTVEVAEDISVPLNLFGVIFPKGSLAHGHGVFVPTTKIDPGFSGRLRLLIVNASGRRMVLTKGQHLGSAVFLRTDATVRHPLVEKREKISPSVQGTGVRFLGMIRRNSGLLASIIIPLIGLLITFASVWYAREAVKVAQLSADSAAASEASIQSATAKSETRN